MDDDEDDEDKAEAEAKEDEEERRWRSRRREEDADGDSDTRCDMDVLETNVQLSISYSSAGPCEDSGCLGVLDIYQQTEQEKTEVEDVVPHSKPRHLRPWPAVVK